MLNQKIINACLATMMSLATAALLMLTVHLAPRVYTDIVKHWSIECKKA